MKKNLTDISIILDESGSMNSIREATIESLLSFVNTQKVNGEENVFSLYTFNHTKKNRFITKDSRVIEDSDFTNYNPGGSTALYDTVCKVIDETGQRLRDTPEKMRPGRVLVCIITDGYDNVFVADHTVQDAYNRIKHQESKYGWTFVFLGANIDVEKTVADLGISVKNSRAYSHSAQGVMEGMRKMSEGTNTYKSSTPVGQACSNFFGGD